MSKVSIVFIGFAVFLMSAIVSPEREIAFWQEPTIVYSTADQPLVLEIITGSVSQEAIFLRKTKDNIPLHYFKKVKGEVCSGKECRLLDIEVYWNITGRYLGFVLPNGEYLSKNDHEPFTNVEYQQLHSILADESLPLDKVSFEELLEQPQNGLDAVSGATSKSIAEMVVKGAAYTTFKLWNTVNGNTMDLVSTLTEKQLNPQLVDRILHSKDVTDKLWALNRLDANNELTPQLETTLLGIISSDDFYLSYSAIKSLSSTHLKSIDLQNSLFVEYQKANHSIKTSILKKLMEAPLLSSAIVKSTRDLLPQLSGQQLKGILELYIKHRIKDMETYSVVANILQNENKFISKTAYDFLIDQKVTDERIIMLLRASEK